MKVKIENTTLGAALKRALRIVSGKTAIPILGNVIVEARGSGVTVYATNLDQSIRFTLPAEVEEVGTICVPAKRLSDIVGQSQSEVSLESDGLDAKITSGRFRAKIQGIDASEFPQADLKDEQSFRVEGPKIAEAIHKTIFAASTDESRYVLNGIYLESHPGAGLRLVATDGRQLACADLEAGEAGDIDAIVPTLAADLIQSIGEETGVVQVSLGKTHIRVTGDDVEMTSRIIEGKFPDYRAVMPDPAELRHVGEIPREPVRSALRRVSLVVNPKLCSISIEGNGDGITFEGRDGAETAVEKVECQCGEFSISVNPNYLSRFLGSVSDDTLPLQFIDDSRPMLIEAKGLQYVIMPMRKG